MKYGKTKEGARTLVLALIVFGIYCQTADAGTIVMLRHGEKPNGGLGQLNCQGLNRALALPAVLIGRFGRPAAIFVPNPGKVKKDDGLKYNYIRPLATIEPTAIRLGMPVNTRWGYEDIESLEDDLLSPELQDKTVFVVWEHRLLVELARDLLKKNDADPRIVPHWDGSDFDSIYVIETTTSANKNKQVSFKVQQQGLNKLKSTCPGE